VTLTQRAHSTHAWSEPLPSSNDHDHDRAFCDAALPEVSRTFALSIQLLPEHLRAPVQVAYLLCRIVDTIEDDPHLNLTTRRALFAHFDRLLGDDTRDASTFESAANDADLGLNDGERSLVRGAGAVFREYRALTGPRRDAIRPWVLEMSAGMRAFIEHAPDGQLEIDSIEDLERYCYYVAGTVGGLLTSLFALELDRPTNRTVPRLATRFGLGLQLVNILKDVAEDAARGTVFLPREVLDAHDLDSDNLLDPDARCRALAAVRTVTERARAHLVAANRYTLEWPAEAAHVRMFCAVPLGLAWATLREVERSPDTLRPGATPKVSREVVGAVVAACQQAAGDDARLETLLHGWAA
jgi:farnesyl-diphosphate farnesyltransferase